jgi:XTP/dITP diphosphohydrolase
MKIIVATGNMNKLREMREILGSDNVTLTCLKDEGLENVEIIEDGKTFEENAIKKALTIAKVAGVPVLADDSGLVVDALGGEPGIYSARYLGRDTSYDYKNQYIIDKLAGLEGDERSARFVCACAVAWPDGKVITTEGVIEGQIGFEIKGENGFGYDPIFYLPERGMTTAEISAEDKNEISHRGRALTAMYEKLKQEGLVL